MNYSEVNFDMDNSLISSVSKPISNLNNNSNTNNTNTMNNTNNSNTNTMNNSNTNTMNNSNTNTMNNMNNMNNTNTMNTMELPNIQQLPTLPTMGRIGSLYTEPQPTLVNDEPEEPPKPNNVKLIQLGIIITFSFFTALAWNEAARYYIGRSIKFYTGKPVYYIYYAAMATFLTCLSYLYSYLK